jgi:DNA-binding NarL/FixJ family response regulator
VSTQQQTPRIAVVIADDHPTFRHGLKQVIAADSRFVLAGEARDGAEALELIEKLRPDLAILDLNMPQVNGWEVARVARERAWRTRFIALTMLQEEAAFNTAMNVGMEGYLLKESAVEEIVSCLVNVAAGLPYVSPALGTFLLKRRQRAEALASHTPTIEDLTVAERRVLKRIAEKRSSKEIAAELQISPRTVDTHRANIGAKLGLRGNNSLLQFAIENREALAQLD